MPKTSIVVVVFAAACTATVPEPDGGAPPEPPDLQKTRTMAGELPVVGLDSDRAGGLWLAYVLVPGHAPATDNVRIVHVDAHGAKLAELRYSDPDPRIEGLAFSGDALWLNVAPGVDGNEVRKLDPETGGQLASFPVEAGISDLEVDVHRGELLLSSVYDRVIALDLATGAETWRAQLWPVMPGYEGRQSAIAVTEDGLLWVGSRYTDRFAVFDQAHLPIASYSTDVTWNHHVTDFRLYLAWDAQAGQVIAAAENQISWLVPRGGRP